MRQRASTLALALVTALIPGLSGSTESVAGEALVALVSGRSWALSTYGNLGNPATTMVWDFRRDGSVCARPGASKVGDKCFDEGRWNIRANVFCWNLGWFGDSIGVRSACSTVRRVGPEQFELRNEKTPELAGIAAKPL